MERRSIQCSNHTLRLKAEEENQQRSFEEMEADSDSGDRTCANLRLRPAVMGCAKRLSAGSDRTVAGKRSPARGRGP